MIVDLAVLCGVLGELYTEIDVLGNWVQRSAIVGNVFVSLDSVVLGKNA